MLKQLLLLMLCGAPFINGMDKIGDVPKDNKYNDNQTFLANYIAKISQRIEERNKKLPTENDITSQEKNRLCQDLMCTAQRDKKRCLYLLTSSLKEANLQKITKQFDDHIACINKHIDPELDQDQKPKADSSTHNLINFTNKRITKRVETLAVKNNHSPLENVRLCSKLMCDAIDDKTRILFSMQIHEMNQDAITKVTEHFNQHIVLICTHGKNYSYDAIDLSTPSHDKFYIETTRKVFQLRIQNPNRP